MMPEPIQTEHALVELMAKAIRAATIDERRGSASGNQDFDALTHKYAREAADRSWEQTGDVAKEMWRNDARAALTALLGAFPDHFVTFDSAGWFIEHSMECRVAGTIGTCDFNRAIREVYDEPAPEDEWGRWRITDIDSEGLPSLERDGGK